MSALGDQIRAIAGGAGPLKDRLLALAVEADQIATPPPPPPPTGNLPCAGFEGTEVIDVSWTATPKRYLTKGFRAGMAVVARFTVPINAKSTALGSISFTEYGDTSHTRWATFSDRPCCWSDPGGGALFLGTEQISARFWLQAGQAKAGYPVLIPGRTYYLNIRNTTAAGTPTVEAGVSTNIGIDWSKPPGV
jgi:hypothetical protein